MTGVLETKTDLIVGPLCGATRFSAGVFSAVEVRTELVVFVVVHYAVGVAIFTDIFTGEEVLGSVAKSTSKDDVPVAVGAPVHSESAGDIHELLGVGQFPQGAGDDTVVAAFAEILPDKAEVKGELLMLFHGLVGNILEASLHFGGVGGWFAEGVGVGFYLGDVREILLRDG